MKKKIVKSRNEYADASSAFLHLPDEILLQILNKLIDLKTLCFCYLVSKRFSLIVLEVDAISYTAPLINPPIPDKNTVGDVPPSKRVPPIRFLLESESFLSAERFLRKFRRTKSLRIEFPSSSEIGIDRCLFKWMVKCDSRFKSFMFLWTNSIFDMDGFCVKGNGDEDLQEVTSSSFKNDMSIQCMKDAMIRHWMLLYFVKNLRMLEKISITDSGRRGRISLSGIKLSELKECVHSASENVFNLEEVPYVVGKGYIPVLKLPVSGYVMKGIYFVVMKMKDVQGGYDDLMKSDNDGFEDKEEAVYNEAVREILEKHMDAMVTVVVGLLV